MSGSGNSGFGSRSSNNVNCHDLLITGLVASPNPAITSKLKIGDHLKVELIEDDDDIVYLFFDGDVVGGFTSSSLSKLIDCLKKGINYTGKIESIVSGQITVRIFHDSE